MDADYLCLPGIALGFVQLDDGFGRRTFKTCGDTVSQFDSLVLPVVRKPIVLVSIPHLSLESSTSSQPDHLPDGGLLRATQILGPHQRLTPLIPL